MSEPVALVTVGPVDHGISRFGRELADAMLVQGFRGTVLHQADPSRLSEVVERLPDHTRLVHLQANDWLFTDGSTDVGDRIAEFSAALRRHGRALTVTLHDLPQTGVSAELFRRRAHIYRVITELASGVVVSSEHERELLLAAMTADRGPDFGGLGGPHEQAVEIIPLPVGLAGAQRPRRRTQVGRSTVGIFGFIYPGKGHQDVLSELAALRQPITVRAIGRPSDGHESMLDELRSSAAALGLAFECTGYLADADVARQLRMVDVPVAPHPQVSASASINSWIAAGRRPLVLAGRYARELDRRMPGAVALYEPGGLAQRVRQALDDFTLTVIAEGTPVGPSWPEVARHHLRWFDRRLGVIR